VDEAFEVGLFVRLSYSGLGGTLIHTSGQLGAVAY